MHSVRLDEVALTLKLELDHLKFFSRTTIVPRTMILGKSVLRIKTLRSLCKITNLLLKRSIFVTTTTNLGISATTTTLSITIISITAAVLRARLAIDIHKLM
jgi:hypothetical protein